MNGPAVIVVADARPLAALLAAAGVDKPLWPTVSRGEVRTAFSTAMRARVGEELRRRGLSEQVVTELLAALDRQGFQVEPAPTKESYDDPTRDEGLRVAVAAGAQVYLTEDAELLDLVVWKGINIVGDAAGVYRFLLKDEETAVVYRAPSEEMATLVAEALECAGISAQVVSQQVPWYDGVLVMGQGFWGDVVVFKKDLALAREVVAGVLSEFDKPPAVTPNGSTA